MKKAEIKTKQNDADVADYLNKVEPEQKRKDSFVILEMMKKVTGEEPKMWGGAIIGYGFITVKSPATGREVDWFRMGFAPRKASLTLYIPGAVKQYEEQLKQLGKHKTGGGCLYINKLDDVDLKVLQEIMKLSAKKGFTN